MHLSRYKVRTLTLQLDQNRKYCHLSLYSNYSSNSFKRNNEDSIRPNPALISRQCHSVKIPNKYRLCEYRHAASITVPTTVDRQALLNTLIHGTHSDRVCVSNSCHFTISSLSLTFSPRSLPLCTNAAQSLGRERHKYVIAPFGIHFNAFNPLRRSAA